MHTLLQYCTPRIDPVLLLLYSKKKWKTRNLLRPVLREILHLRNLWLLGYLRMRQVFRRQVFRKG